jgi:dienelactone hydrolase
MAALEGLTVQEETVEDAVAAAQALRASKDVDPANVFVLGHSLGGMLIPRIGLSDPTLTGFIVLAGSARPLEEVALEQVRYIQSLGLDMSDQEREGLARMERELERVRDLYAGKPLAPGERIFGASPAYWLDLRGYEPAHEATRLNRPILILHAGRDYQVTMDDFALWKEALADTEGVEFRIYPELNHLFMPGEGRSTPSEYLKPGNVAEAVVTEIAAWVKTR